MYVYIYLFFFSSSVWYCITWYHIILYYSVLYCDMLYYISYIYVYTSFLCLFIYFAYASPALKPHSADNQYRIDHWSRLIKTRDWPPTQYCEFGDYSNHMFEHIYHSIFNWVALNQFLVWLFGFLRHR